MVKCITYKTTDGSVAVCRPVENARMVKSSTIDGVVTTYDPAVPLFSIQRRPASETIEGSIASLDPEWAETEQEFVERIAKTDVPPNATDITIVDDAALPQDRTFRAAWAFHKDHGAVVDMPRARSVWKDRIRAVRAPLLASLDVDYQRADETGDAAAKGAIAAKKQVLRDLTKHAAIDAAVTPDELKKVWPEALRA